MLDFKLIHPRASHEMLGYFPGFLSADDPRPAIEQIDSNYKHGGGWRDFNGFDVWPDSLRYPGDQPRPLLATAQLRDETINFYDGAWVAVLQKDGTHRIARID